MNSSRRRAGGPIFLQTGVTTEAEIGEALLESVRPKRVLCGGRRVAIRRERPWRLSPGLPLRTVSTRLSLTLRAARATLPRNFADRRIRPQLVCQSWWHLPESEPN